MFLLTEQFTRQAKSGDEQTKELPVVRFAPLCTKCARQAGLMLPQEERDVLLGEVHYEFLLLLSQFEPQRGLSFGCYICETLPRRVLNWAHREQ